MIAAIYILHRERSAICVKNGGAGWSYGGSGGVLPPEGNVMPDADDAGRPSGDLELEPPARSRRSLLKGAAAGAAGVAAAALAAGAMPAAAGSRPAGPVRGAGTASAAGSEPVVVHVRDAATGEMDVFRGTTCTRVHDSELAARLVRAGG